MSHCDSKALKKLKSKDSNLSELKSFVCEECIVAKATVKVNHSVSINKRTEYLQLVQSDLFDSTQELSFSNKKYFITFLDSYSKWLEVETLSSKT